MVGRDFKISLIKGKKTLSLCQKAQRLATCNKFDIHQEFAFGSVK